MIYSNPCKVLHVKDWPYGRGIYVECIFSIEENKGKERAIRITAKPNGIGHNKPKKLTYTKSVVFVDGNDGRTYILNNDGEGSHISVMQSNMKLQEEVIYPDDSRYSGMIKFFDL